MADEISFTMCEWENMSLTFTWHTALTATNTASQCINMIIWNNKCLCIQSFNLCFQDQCGGGGLQHVYCTVPCFGYGTQLLLFLDELSQLVLQRHIFTMYLFNKWMLQQVSD